MSLQGRRGTARTRGPADLWPGTAWKSLERNILARHGPENIGTEKYWHGMARKNPIKSILGKDIFGSGSIKLFLLGGCRPPTERLRLSGSPFFLGTKILEAPNLWVLCRRRFFVFRKIIPIFLEAPNLGAGS